MEKTILEVQSRDAAAPAKALRNGNIIPAVFYGKGEKNMSLQVDYQTFRRLFIKSGSQLIDLVIDGKTNKKALVHDIQYDPLSGKINHVDFLRVSLKEAITTEVAIELVGVAPAVKDFGGVLNQIKDTVEIKCLPTDIPKFIEVDISNLLELNASIHISELVVPKDVVLLDTPEDVVVIVNPPRVEEEEPTPAEEGAEGEVAEGEEGATAEGEGGEGKSEEGGEAAGEAKEA